MVNLICDIEPYDYRKTFVSIFDHSLSREEASGLLDNVAPEEQKRRDDSFCKFNEILIQSTACYKVSLRGIKKNRVLFKQFNTEKAALDYINPFSWPHFLVALPEYEAIYHQSWDDTVIFFYLKKRVSDGLRNDGEGTSPWFGTLHTKLAYGIPALIFGLDIGGAAMQYLNAWQFRGNQLDAIVSAHIHSLMADHLTDIASSDTHAVKPWFHERIDFSPPINDLTSHGYPVIGGRLEYMAGNSVAALVYRHRQHAINLFISPKALRSDGVKSKTFSG